MDSEHVESALGQIEALLRGVNFAFIGSASLYIQGLDVSPRDIDILTTEETIYEIDRLLEKYRTKDIYFDETEGRNSLRSFYGIGGIEVEVLGNRNNVYRPVDSLNQKALVSFGGMKLPCIPLEKEMQAYTNMGRKDKAAKIMEFLAQQSL